MDNKKDKCAHPNCSCAATPGSRYCSPQCQTAKTSAEISCECGHPNCAGRIA